MNPINSYKCIGVLITSIFVQNSHAAFSAIVETDGAGSFLGDSSWTESGSNVDGTVTAGFSPPSSFTNLVSGFTNGGTFEIGTIGSGAGSPNILDGASYSGSNIIDSNVSLTMNIDLGDNAASADLQLGSSVSINSQTYNSNIALANISGTDELSVTFEFSQFLHAQRRSASNGAPFLAGLRSDVAVAGGVDVTATYNDIGYFTGNPGAGQTWTDGLPSGGSFVTMDGQVGSWGDTATHSWTMTNLSFQGVNAYDVDGSGLSAPSDASQMNGTLDEIERVHGSSITFLISRNDGMNFDGTEQFLFSFTGMQSDDVNLSLVPEPSSLFFSFLSGSIFVFYRRKKKQ